MKTGIQKTFEEEDENVGRAPPEQSPENRLAYHRL